MQDATSGLESGELMRVVSGSRDGHVTQPAVGNLLFFNRLTSSVESV